MPGTCDMRLATNGEPLITMPTCRSRDCGGKFLSQTKVLRGIPLLPNGQGERYGWLITTTLSTGLMSRRHQMIPSCFTTCALLRKKKKVHKKHSSVESIRNFIC